MDFERHWAKYKKLFMWRALAPLNKELEAIAVLQDPFWYYNM